MGGWEPREFTEYVYEDDRLVGTITSREPEWDAEQLALVIGFEADEAARGSHGFLMAEATSPESNPANNDATRVYRANEVPVVDYAEKARRDAADKYYKKWDKPDHPVNRNGHIWRVTEQDPADSL